MPKIEVSPGEGWGQETRPCRASEHGAMSDSGMRGSMRLDLHVIRRCQVVKLVRQLPTLVRMRLEAT